MSKVLTITKLEHEDRVDRKDGFCLYCGDYMADNVPLDATGEVCPECKKKSVLGALQAVKMGFVEVK